MKSFNLCFNRGRNNWLYKLWKIRAVVVMVKWSACLPYTLTIWVRSLLTYTFEKNENKHKRDLRNLIFFCRKNLGKGVKFLFLMASELKYVWHVVPRLPTYGVRSVQSRNWTSEKFETGNRTRLFMLVFLELH